MGMLSARAAVPALPGAQKMRSASGDWAKEWTRACSLPPPPTTSTRMRPPTGVALAPGGASAGPARRPQVYSGRARRGRGGGRLFRPPAAFRQIDFWYTRNARVASHVQIRVKSASQPMRLSTALQSGLVARPSRPALTAHSTGL